MGGEKAQFEVKRASSGLSHLLGLPNHEIISQLSLITSSFSTNSFSQVLQRRLSTSLAGRNVYPAPEALLGNRLPEKPKEDLIMSTTRDSPKTLGPEILPPPPPYAHNSYQLHNCDSSGPHGQRRKWKVPYAHTLPTPGNKAGAEEKDRWRDDFPGRTRKKIRDWLKLGTGDVSEMRFLWSAPAPPQESLAGAEPQPHSKYCTVELGLRAACAGHTGCIWKPWRPFGLAFVP